MLKVIHVIMFTFTHTIDITQTTMKYCYGVTLVKSVYYIRGNINGVFDLAVGSFGFKPSNYNLPINSRMHMHNLNIFRKVVNHRY